MNPTASSIGTERYSNPEAAELQRRIRVEFDTC
jgi:hypothetical protein